MTDRARLTVEDALRLILPMAKGYAAEHPVGNNAQMVAAAEEALSDLRRESAAPDGGLSGEQIEKIRAEWVGDLYPTTSEVNALCDMALRSLERPAGRVVPDGWKMVPIVATEEMQIAGHKVRVQHMPGSPEEKPFAGTYEIWDAMLAASPPAATEGAGWVKKNQLASDIDDANKE